MKVKYLDVISKFKQSLNEGLTVLYEGYGQHLFQFTINKWQLDEDEAYDTVYKTLEAVCKVIDRYQFDSENHFSNWLLKIHKNNILQLIRAKKAKDQIVFHYEDWMAEVVQYEDEAFDMSNYEPIVEKLNYNTPYKDSPLNNQLFFAMQKALMLVPDNDREILLLRMNNYTYEEISQMLGIPNISLKVKFNRAKAKVQKKTLEILKDSNHETRRESNAI